MSNPFGKPLTQEAAPAVSTQAVAPVTTSQSVGSVPQGGNPFGRPIAPVTVTTPPPVPVEPEPSRIREIKDGAIIEKHIKTQREGQSVVEEALDYASGVMKGLKSTLGLDNPKLEQMKQSIYGHGSGLTHHTAVTNTTNEYFGTDNKTYDQALEERAREAMATDPTYKDDTFAEVMDKIKYKDMVDIGVGSQVFNPLMWGSLAINNPVTRTAVTMGLGGTTNLATEEVKGLIDERDRTTGDRVKDFSLGAVTTGLVDVGLNKGGDLLQKAAAKIAPVTDPIADAVARLTGKSEPKSSIPDPNKIPFSTPAIRQDFARNSASAIGSDLRSGVAATRNDMKTNVDDMRLSLGDDGYEAKVIPSERPFHEIADERVSGVGKPNEVQTAEIIRRVHQQFGNTPDGIRANVSKIIGSTDDEAINNYLDIQVRKAIGSNTKRVQGQHRKGLPNRPSDQSMMVRADRWERADFAGVTPRDYLADPDALIDRITYFDDAIAASTGAARKDLTKQKAQFMKEFQGLKGFGKFMHNYSGSRATHNTLREAGFVNSNGNVFTGSDLNKALVDYEQYPKLSAQISKLPKSKQQAVRGQLVAELVDGVDSIEAYRQLVQFRPRIIQDLDPSMRSRFDGLDKALFRPLGDNLPIETIKEIQKTILNRRPSDKELLTLLDNINKSKSEKVVEAQVQKLVKVLDKRGLPVTATPVVAGTVPDNER